MSILKTTVENIVASVRQNVPLRRVNPLLTIKVQEMFNSPRKILFIEILEGILFEFERIIESRERIRGHQMTRSEYITQFKEDIERILNYKEFFEEHGADHINEEILAFGMDDVSYIKTGVMFRTQEKDLFFQIIIQLIDTVTEQ